MAVLKLQGPQELSEGCYYEYDTAADILGEGGMGRVYKGKRVDRNGGETVVAIKAMYEGLPDLVIERARREASIRLKNDSLVQMYGFIETPGFDILGEEIIQYHVVSEYLDGITLADLIVGNLKDRNGDIHPQIKRIYEEFLSEREVKATEIIKSVLSGIMALHDVGYIHRDIDPTNIMVTTAGKYKLIDFGVAKQLVRLNTTDKGLTSSGQFLGKAGYAAPELVLGDVRNQNYSTDVYAVGILYYQLLTGHLPFQGTSYNQMEAQLHKKMVLKDIKSYQIKTVIEKATEKRQRDRYSTSAQFRAAIDSFVFPEPWHLNKIKVAWVSVVATIALLVGAYFLIPRPEPEPTIDELYAMYLEDLNSADTTRVISGFEGMKQLSDQEYLPAMREVARTYLWAPKDSLYMSRKKILGIEVHGAAEKNDDGSPMDGLPKEKEINFDAFELSRKIIKMSDSTDCFYMLNLTHYYIYGSGGIAKNLMMAQSLAEKCCQVAEREGDTKYIEASKVILDAIKTQINNESK